MDRRAWLTAIGAWPLASTLVSGCQRPDPPAGPVPPGASSGASGASAPPADEAPFSAQRLISKLETLRQAFEAKGFAVSGALEPGIEREALRRQCDWFPFALPDEILALYEWRGGQRLTSSAEGAPFWFRDCIFATPDRARSAYATMMASYGAVPEFQPLLRGAFPFADFQGAWLVLSTQPQNVAPLLKRPIFYVFQGVELHYYSIERLVDTAIDWVREDQYAAAASKDKIASRQKELEIWRRHNPGIHSR